MHILKISPAYRFIRVIWAMALKDIKSTLTERAFMLTSIIIPINFLLLFLLFALTGGQAPTAVVLEDNGPYAPPRIDGTSVASGTRSAKAT